MDYPNRGTLWTNTYKKTEAQPDMKGDIKLELDLVKELLADPEKAAAMGKAARQTILDKFSLPKFVSNWNYLFERVIS